MSEPTNEDDSQLLSWSVFVITVLLLFMSGVGGELSFVIGQFIGLLAFVLLLKLGLRWTKQALG